MKRPKVGVYKLFTFPQNGKSRWFGARFTQMLETGKVGINPIPKNIKRPRLPVIDLKNHPEIETEKQFLFNLLEEFGEGNFLVTAYGGRANTYVFWKGIIRREGYTFFKHEYNRKEIMEWKRDMVQEMNEGDKEGAKITEGLIKDQIENLKKEKSKKRYGFVPFLKFSGKRGVLNDWNTPDLQSYEHSWGEQEKQESSDFENWGKSEKPELEVWN